jgi:hypothetical protein
MTVRDDESWMRDLLAPLHRLEPVSLTSAGARRPRRLARRATVVASLILTSLAVAAGIAFASGTNPFSSIAAFAGIGAADHARGPSDVVTGPQIARMVRNYNRLEALMSRHTGTPPAHLLPDTARLIGSLPSGLRLYVVGTTNNELCEITVLATPKTKGMRTLSCSNPLSQRAPTTIGSQDLIKNGPDATPPLTYGVARNGVTAVTFMAHGRETTIPVVHNVWAYEGTNSALKSITLHYADGRTETITH